MDTTLPNKYNGVGCGFMDKVTCFVLLIVFSIVVTVVLGAIRRHQINDKFENREELTYDEFYERFYRDSEIPREVIIEILRSIEKHYPLPVGRLRPQDRFDKELAEDQRLIITSSYSEDFLEENYYTFDEEARMKGIDLEKELMELESIDDYVRTIASVRQGERTSGKDL